MNKPNKPKNYRLLLGILVVVAIAAIVLAFSLIPTNQRINYAESTAAPIEEALVNAGGKIISSGGDDGRGVDNQTPYYDATLDVPLNEEGAIKLVSDISSNNGYKLVHASKDQRGHLGAVADKYIDEWYFDNTSKTSSYAQLDDGKIKLAFHVGDEDIKVEKGHTVVRLNIQLPQLK